VAYEGSPDWHRQLRIWRRADAIIWVLGTLYCLFAVNYVGLFFANVAAQDQGEWMGGGGICFFVEFVFLPVGIGFIFALVALVSISYISWRYGLARSHITQHGSVETLREVFEATRERGAIQRALINADGLAASASARSLQSGRGGSTSMRESGTDSYDYVLWNHFELDDFHDVGCATVEYLLPRSVG